MSPRAVLATSLGLVLGFALGCDPEEEISNEEACENIMSACHLKDDGSDPMINGCHETAHNEGDCLKDYDACLEACNAAPELTGGHETDHHGSTGHDHGSTGG